MNGQLPKPVVPYGGPDPQSRWSVALYLLHAGVFMVLAASLVIPGFVAGVFDRSFDNFNLDRPLLTRWVTTIVRSAGRVGVVYWIWPLAVLLPLLTLSLSRSRQAAVLIACLVLGVVWFVLVWIALFLGTTDMVG